LEKKTFETLSSSSRKSFGIGLEVVLEAVNQSVDTDEGQANSKKLKNVMVQQVFPGRFQPRKEFDPNTLKELSDSISRHGILQPIIVRENERDQYEIIAGERRWRAAQMAGLQQVPVIVCNITDESALAFGLIENIQRQDLNPIEEASAMKRLIEEFKMTHEKLSESIGRSRASVSNMLRLLNLATPVQTLVAEKKIDVGHAKILLVFSFEEQEKLANIIYTKKMSVREAENLIKSKKNPSKNQNEVKVIHEKCDEWGDQISNKLQARSEVFVNQQGFGKIIIHVRSTNEIEQLIKNI
jgi:ParB family chromosome partitioning protein